MSRLPIRDIITTWKACNQNYSTTARQLGIDRRTVKRWVDRGRQPWGYVRWQGVHRCSTAPKHPTRALSYEAMAQVRAWREATGFCREKLAFLAKAQRLNVSASTIHRTLQRSGLIRASTKRRLPFDTPPGVAACGAYSPREAVLSRPMLHRGSSTAFMILNLGLLFCGQRQSSHGLALALNS